MNKFLSAALLAAIAIPAVASAGEAPAKRSFTRDGETFVYTSVAKGDKTLLTGRAYPSGRDFSLTVRGNRVRGYAGGTPVSFVADTNRSGSGVAVATR